MYGQQQSNFFLPDGLSNSSSSSIESAFNLGCSLYNNDLSFPSQTPTPQLPPLFGQSQQENSAFKRHLDHVINGKEGKMFVGGLSWLSTTESMRAYFEKFGPVEECVIMRDAKTKITRGFGFVTFENPVHIKRVLSVNDHFLDGKRIDPQIAIRHISPARSVNNISRKVFIGGVSQQCTIEDVKKYFSQFGQVEDAILKMDYPKQQHRGFGFMTFVNASTADFVCFIRYHQLGDKTVECKMAQKKEFVKPNGEAALAASNFLNSLPPEQVLAIYGVLLKSVANNCPQHQQSNSILQSFQQISHQHPAPMSPQPQRTLPPSMITNKLPNPIGTPLKTKTQSQVNMQQEALLALQQQQQAEHDQLMLDNTHFNAFHRQLLMKSMPKQFSNLDL